VDTRDIRTDRGMLVLQLETEVFHFYQLIFDLFDKLSQKLLVELEGIPGDLLDLRNVGITAIPKPAGLDKDVSDMNDGGLDTVILR